MRLANSRSGECYLTLHSNGTSRLRRIGPPPTHPSSKYLQCTLSAAAQFADSSTDCTIAVGGQCLTRRADGLLP